MHHPHIAMLKTKCLFLVVVMHCVMFFATPFPFWKLYADSPQPLADLVTAISGTTLIQSFMMASGFLFAAAWDSGKRTPLQHLLHRGRRLVLPWLGVGMLWGWLPCGLVYSASLTAMASGSAAGGATGMLAFALGTLPNLLAMGAFAEGLRGWLTRLWVRRVAGMAVVAMALWQLWPVLGQWSQASA